MSGRARFSVEDVLRMRQLRWEQRHSVKEVAAAFDCCLATVFVWTSDPDKLPIYAETTSDRIAQLANAGHGRRVIAERIRKGVKYVDSALHKLRRSGRIGTKSAAVVLPGPRPIAAGLTRAATSPAAGAIQDPPAAGFSGWRINAAGKLVFRGAASLTGAGMRP